jgi:hypothetical protein
MQQDTNRLRNPRNSKLTPPTDHQATATTPRQTAEATETTAAPTTMSQEGSFPVAEANKLEGDLNFITWKVHMKVAFMRGCVWYTLNRVFLTGTNHQDDRTRNHRH